MAGIGVRAENEERALPGLITKDAPEQWKGARGSFGDEEVDGAVHKGKAALAAE